MKKYLFFLCCLLVTVLFCNFCSCAKSCAKKDGPSDSKISRSMNNENGVNGAKEKTEVLDKGGNITLSIGIDTGFDITISSGATSYFDFTIDGTSVGKKKIPNITSSNPTTTDGLREVGTTKLGDSILVGRSPDQKGYNFLLFVAYRDSPNPTKPWKITDVEPGEVYSFHTEKSSETGADYKYVKD